MIEVGWLVKRKLRVGVSTETTAFMAAPMAAPIAVPHGRSFWPPQRQLKRRAADGTVALQPAACACVTGVRPKTLFI